MFKFTRLVNEHMVQSICVITLQNNICEIQMLEFLYETVYTLNISYSQFEMGYIFL